MTWSEDFILISNVTADQIQQFATADTKLYVPVATLSTQENVKLLNQVKSILKEQLTGINANQSYEYRHETNI